LKAIEIKRIVYGNNHPLTINSFMQVARINAEIYKTQ